VGKVTKLPVIRIERPQLSHRGSCADAAEENDRLRTALEQIRYVEGINPTAYKIATEALKE
jgi:hypothetical protein